MIGLPLVPTINPLIAHALAGEAPPIHRETPPAHLLPSILDSIERHTEHIPPDADAALVGRIDNDGWRGAIIVRAPHGWDIHGWVGGRRVRDGKDERWTDQKIDFGLEVLKTWKF